MTITTTQVGNFKRGWLVGSFEPAITNRVAEVGLQSYLAGEVHEPHFHVIGTEINTVVNGTCEIKFVDYSNIHGQKEIRRFNSGDIFIVHPGCCIEFSAISDCQILVMKSHSIPKDKIVIADSVWNQSTSIKPEIPCPLDLEVRS